MDILRFSSTAQVPPLCNMFAIDLHGTTCTFSLPSRPPARRAPRNVPVPGAPRARGAAGREEGQYGKCLGPKLIKWGAGDLSLVGESTKLGI